MTLHPKKTRLIPLRPPVERKNHGSDGDVTGPGSVDLLGFTHFWGRSRRGHWVVKRKTAKGRFGRALQRIAGNSQALVRFKFEVERIWRKWLGTRSWHGPQSWKWFMALLRRHPLPPPRAVHSVLAHAAKL